MPGIFIREGMTGSVPEFAISFGDDGEPSVQMVMHLHFDVCTTWLGIALDHLEIARLRGADVRKAWAGGTGAEQAAALDRELEPSMQAVVAAAIAIDALYANVRASSTLPASMVESWKKRRPKRFKQVAETLRIAFGLEPDEAADVETNLGKIYRLRDRAVHPAGTPEAPLMRSDIGVAVEWRFGTFRFDVAQCVVHWAFAMCCGLTKHKALADARLDRYMNTLKLRLDLLLPRARTICLESPSSKSSTDVGGG